MSHTKIATARRVPGGKPLAGAAGSRASDGGDAAAKPTVTRGKTLPIYVPPPLLAEAEKSSVPLAASGGGFWAPGPERFHGWAVRDYLQRMTGARFPLAAPDAQAGPGTYAGALAQLSSFEPQGQAARRAFASPGPEAFVVEAQRDRLFVVGRSQLGLIAAIYTLRDGRGCKWFAPGAHWENVPERDGLTLDAKLNVASVTAYALQAA